MKPLRIIFAMSILLGVFIAPIVLIPSVNAQEGQVTLNPSDDTYTDSLTVPPMGDGNLLNVGTYTEAYTDIAMTWLKFNLSDVPDGAVVDVATLELDAFYLFLGDSYNVCAHSCSDNSWTELTLTYANMPSFNATPMDSTVITEKKWYSWNVTDAVREAVNGLHGGPDVVTIILSETEHGSIAPEVGFSSKEFINPPKLTVHWNDVIPEFPTWTSMLLIIIGLTVAVAICKQRLLKTPIH